MNLRPYIVLFLIIFNELTFAQQIQVKQLSRNGINARINNTYPLFLDFQNGLPSFEVPKGSNTHAFSGSSLTMGGIDSNSSLRMASSLPSATDYSTGPLAIGSAVSSDSIKMIYNRIWEVNRIQINRHRSNFSNPLYRSIVPKDILEWPAHGDTNLGYDYNLAPFIDVNQNGLYEPHSGDYPDIEGDFAFYFINNDNSLNAATNTFQIGVEIHCMIYGYDRTDALNKALFVDYKVINRSNLIYNDFYIGKYINPDLGNPEDDFVEADVNRGMVFVKNGDSFDEPRFGLSGYGNHPAAAGILVLRGPYMDENSLDDSCLNSPIYTPNGWGFEDGEIDNEQFGLTYFVPFNNNNTVSDGLPSLAIHHYNYMRGLFKNGRPLTFGGSPFNISDTECRIAYFKDTDPSFYSTFGDTVTNNWTEDGNNSPGDRMAMLSSGPFTFEPNEKIHLTYAFIFAQDLLNPGVEAGVDSLKRNADIIREFYFRENNLTNCFEPTIIEEIKSSELTVFPVPTRDFIKVKNLSLKSDYNLFSINGKLLKQGTLNGSNEEIDISSLESGIYLFQIQNSQGVFQTKLMLSK